MKLSVNPTGVLARRKIIGGVMALWKLNDRNYTHFSCFSHYPLVLLANSPPYPFSYCTASQFDLKLLKSGALFFQKYLGMVMWYKRCESFLGL